MNLNELRKYFYESSDYVIRIRNDNDIVYYRGIKIFFIKDNFLELSGNIFNVNKKIFDKYGENEAATAEALNKNIRNKIKGFLTVKDSAKIVFNESTSETYSVADKDSVREQIEEHIRNNEKLNKYFQYDKEKIKIKSKNNDIDKEKYRYFLKLIRKCEPDETAEAECSLLKYFVSADYYYKKGWTKPTFDLFEAKIKLNELYINNGRLVLCKNGDEEITDEAVREAVKAYEEYAYEAEKNYQHLFMTDNKIRYKANEFNGIFRFEEEYAIEGGRVDNIFVKFNGSSSPDLYLIELKYGSKVIGGSNGVLKHLKDIKTLMGDKNKIDEIKNNINNRISWINENVPGEEYNAVDKFNNIHFWVIIGYAESEAMKGQLKKESVEKRLKGINKKKKISDLMLELEKCECSVKIFLDKTEFSESEKISLTDAKLEPWTYD